MIVEFMGSSGAGKSTLLRAVQRQLAQSTAVVESSAFLLGLAGLRRVSHPTARNVIQELGGLPFFLLALRHFGRFAAFTAGLFSLSTPVPVDWLRNVRGLERKLAVYEICRRRSAQGMILVDEGPLLAAHSFVFGPVPPTPAEINHFASLAPLPDVVVYVRASVATLVRRTLQRPDPPREMRQRAAVQTEMFAQRTVAVFDQLAAAPAIRARLIRVDNTDGGEAVIDRLAGHVAATLLHWRGPGDIPAPVLREIG